MTADAIAGNAVDLTVGDVHISRIEELYGAMFPLDALLPKCTDEALGEWDQKLFSPFLDFGSKLAVISIHTWLVRTPRSIILIDTCNGNHKERPNLPDFGGLDTPWLQRLEAAGVKPEEVTHVICTHLHLDHVGWNTTLRNGRWEPTFPNATYWFNRSEFEFWRPDNPANEPLAFNAGVFEDSVAPVFDREKVKFWDGDQDIDEVFHMEMATGHTPGHAIAWLESKDQRVLFAGDSMHSPMQVFEPSWACGFDLDPSEAERSRRDILAACVERNALLLPAHFSAPHVYRVEETAKGFAAVPAI